MGLVFLTCLAMCWWSIELFPFNICCRSARSPHTADVPCGRVQLSRYIYRYVCIYTYIYYAYIYMYMYTYIYIHVCIYIRVCVCVCVVCVCMYIYIYRYVFVYIYTYKYIHTYIHTYLYIHIYRLARRQFRAPLSASNVSGLSSCRLTENI